MTFKSTLRNVFSVIAHGETREARAAKPALVAALVRQSQPLLDPAAPGLESRLADVLSATKTSALEKLLAAGVVITLEKTLRDTEPAYNKRGVDAVFYAKESTDLGKPVVSIVDNGLTRAAAGRWGRPVAQYAAPALERLADIDLSAVKTGKLVAIRQTYSSGRASAFTVTEWHAAPKPAAPKLSAPKA